MSAKIRVLVVDDHALFRQGVVSFLNEQPDLEVVGAAGNGAEAVALAQRLRPDVVLMDVHMPGEGGISATAAILRQVPETRVLVLTVSDGDADLFAALEAGARGYLLKNASPDEVLRGIRLVYAGQALLSPEMTARLLPHLRSPRILETALPPLTPRERDVLRLVAEGYTNAAIAQALLISENTVKTHLRRLMQKLGVENRTQLVTYALEYGLGPRR